ncbi:MAG: AAA family ATPase [Chloroflexota bacterium]
MRLSKIIIRRFKAITEIELTIPKTDLSKPGSGDFLSLVGENNSSKSSVLDALRLALPGTDIPKPTTDHFPARKEEKGPIEVEFEFDDLTPADEEEQGIRTHVHDRKYRVKKVWDAANVGPTVWAYEIVKEFPTWPNPDTTRSHFENAGEEWRVLLKAYDAESGQFPNRPNKDVKQGLRELAKKLKSPVVIESEPKWEPNPGGFSAHVDSVMPLAIFVPAIKETKTEAEVGQKKSAARQIVEWMFERQLKDHPSIKKFAEAGEAVKELFTGAEGNEIVRSLEKRISNKLARLIDLQAHLDFTPPDVTTNLAGSTELGIVDGQLVTKPEHQGHGAQRALILSLLELLAESELLEVEQPGKFQRGVLLLIEEPEIYLHPQMCRKMHDALLTIARSGAAQVICTTHSPVLLDLADRHDGIVVFRKGKGGISHMQRADDLFGGGGAEDDRSRLRMLLDFDQAVKEVFFTREVCLVEGDCEVASIEATARHLADQSLISWGKYLLARRNLVVVNCRGKWTIRAFQRVLNGFEIPYRVVHDADMEGEEEANAAILGLLSDAKNRRLMHNPNFEQQIFGEVWSSDKPWKATQHIAKSTPLPNDLIRFFSFVLGKKVEELQ